MFTLPLLYSRIIMLLYVKCMSGEVYVHEQQLFFHDILLLTLMRSPFSRVNVIASP